MFFQSLKALLLVAWCCSIQSAFAADIPVFETSIKNHRFEPAEITIPAGTKVKLLVSNQDPGPEEFESHELNREKVIPGGRQAVIYVGPLAPGKYPFFGEFHSDTAQGTITAK